MMCFHKKLSSHILDRNVRGCRRTCNSWRPSCPRCTSLSSLSILLSDWEVLVNKRRRESPQTLSRLKIKEQGSNNIMTGYRYHDGLYHAMQTQLVSMLTFIVALLIVISSNHVDVMSQAIL